jgi:mycothiol synthase
VNLPAGYVARGATRADVDGMLAVLHAGDVLAVGEPDTPRDFVDEVFASPFLDPSRDIWVIEDRHGIVACADLQAVNPSVSCDAFARVHPEHTGRGLSTALLDTAEARARERTAGAERAKLWSTADASDEAGISLLRSRGGSHIRSFLHMERALDDLANDEPVTQARLPEGVRFRAFRSDDAADWETFHRVLEASFSDHFGFEPIDLDTFVTMWTSFPTWDPTLVTFAETEDEVVGLVVSNVTEATGLGWLSDVGVLPAYRGRGIAKALLGRAFADLRAKRCDRVRLNVDSENTTGATGLYEGVGMHVHREWMVFEKVLEAGR